MKARILSVYESQKSVQCPARRIGVELPYTGRFAVSIECGRQYFTRRGQIGFQNPRIAARIYAS